MSAFTNTVRKHRPDYYLVLWTALLMLLGLVVMYAIGPQRAHVLNLVGSADYSDTYFFIKQFFSLSFAVTVFFIAARIPLSWWQKYAAQLVVVSLAACVLLAFFGFLHLGIAPNINGAVRWFNLGPLGSLQPAEFLKFALLLFVAGFLGMRHTQGKINDKDTTIIPVLTVLLVAVFFVIFLQKDMGTGMTLVAIFISMLYAAGMKTKNFVIILMILLALGVLSILTASHRMDRVMTFLSGETSATSSQPSAEQYHITQAKIAIGSGGLFGVGIGNSVQSTGYLPEAINDSVFAIMGEIFGFAGLVVILGIFAALLLRVLRVADHLPNMAARLVAAGVFGWLASHIIINVAAMTGVFPLTGITLPLLSFGGASMAFIAGALGLVFQLSHFTANSTEVEGGTHEDSRGRRRLGRTRYANRSRA